MIGTNTENETQNRDIFLESLAELLRLKTNAERAIYPVTQKYGLTPVQAIILHLINENEPPTVSTVFRTLDLNQGNVSSTCKKLESAGYISRRRSENDERRVVLTLTEKGLGAVVGISDEVAMRYPFFKTVYKEDALLAKECVATLRNLAAKLNEMILNCEGSDSNA